MNASTEVSYATLAPGGIPDGGVARTVEATESIMVDVGKDGTVLGVEVIGEGNWVDGLVALAMQGRLRVAPKARAQATEEGQAPPAAPAAQE